MGNMSIANHIKINITHVKLLMNITWVITNSLRTYAMISACFRMASMASD